MKFIYSLMLITFSLNAAAGANSPKLDILFVVDNSAGMAPLQAQLAENMTRTLDRLQQNNFDFQIAVITTDAFLSLPVWTPFFETSPSYYEGRPQSEKAWFRAGTPTQPSPYRILTPATSSLARHFSRNVMQGNSGFYDERSLQSITASLQNPGNSNFLREGAELKIVILTDEDDFSHDGTQFIQDYADPNLHSVQSYVEALDALTHSTQGARHYTVSSIAIQDQECLQELNTGSQRIAYRISDLVARTGGYNGDICGNFESELSRIFGE